MAGKFFLLHQVTDFAPGYFENTAMEDGCIQLVQSSGSFLLSGTYTSPPFASESFFNLIPSWNADTPRQTSVEMEVRISAAGQWSQWFSFGLWSPFIARASLPRQTDKIAEVRKGSLSLVEGCPAADIVQMRVTLRTENPEKTPKIRLLSVSTNAASKIGQEKPAFARCLKLPSYSAQTRDPAIAGSIASLTSLVMMMNRWGADLLPEEVARIAYDGQSGSFNNLTFLCAAAASFGFVCNASYNGIDALRREVWQGRAVAARVHYRAPELGDAEKRLEDGTPLPPILESATHNSSGHLVVVHGFSYKNGTEYVTMSDPTAKTDSQVVQEIPVASFAKIYTGISIFLRPGATGAKRSAPKRKLATLSVENGTLRLYEDGRPLVPDQLDREGVAPATLCYTLSDGIAYASAAQHKFYYPVRDENGNIPFEHAAAHRRITIYLIGSWGNNWVAEKDI